MKNDELLFRINNELIRKDGKLNAPLLNLNSKCGDLISSIIKHTHYLNSDATISQRIWHITKNVHTTPKCWCGKNSLWINPKYSKYCSQVCATTSLEARQRTKKQFTGVKLSKERIDKIIKRNTGSKRSIECRKKLSDGKLGKKNPQYGKKSWNAGLYGTDNPMFGVKRPGTGLKGKDNPSYGKSPPLGTGFGINGKFNEIHFRSSLELLYLMYWYSTNIIVISAESSDFRVKYSDDKNDIRAYTPDFYIPSLNTVYEIKPEKLQKNKIVQLKFNALIEHHSNLICKLIGYSEISDFIFSIDLNSTINNYIDSGVLKINKKQFERLQKNYGDIIRESAKQV